MTIIIPEVNPPGTAEPTWSQTATRFIMAIDKKVRFCVGVCGLTGIMVAAAAEPVKPSSSLLCYSAARRPVAVEPEPDLAPFSASEQEPEDEAAASPSGAAPAEL